MLPFLKPKATQVGVIVKTRAPDEKPENKDDDSGIEACAQDLINAIHARDVKGVSEAIKSAFEILDSQPHEEGEHIEPHSYEAQNEEVAE